MIRRFLMLLAVLALAATACGGSRVAATYDGGEISVDDVNALIPFDGDTVDATVFANSLFDLIVDRVFTAAAETDYGVVLDDSRVDDSYQALVDEVTSDGALEFDEALAANGVTEARLEAIARQRVIFDDVRVALVADQDPVTEEELIEQYDIRLPSIAEVCSRHILLDTEEDAQAAFDRAVAGEDFAALAVELSTGPSGPDGGDLGCTQPAGFVTEFADAVMEAEVGEPFGPVRSSFGYHVILVESRDLPAFEDVRATLETELTEGKATELFNGWLLGALADADVVVEEQYGTWSLDPAPSVIPPSP